VITEIGKIHLRAKRERMAKPTDKERGKEKMAECSGNTRKNSKHVTLHHEPEGGDVSV
jgi:hypothetical protein